MARHRTCLHHERLRVVTKQAEIGRTVAPRKQPNTAHNVCDVFFSFMSVMSETGFVRKPRVLIIYFSS